MKRYLNSMYSDAERINIENVIAALKRSGPHKTLLDVGCWDGENTLKWAAAATAEKIYGIETIAKARIIAEKNHIKTFGIRADVDKWPIRSHSLDCIVSNQVVEHLTNMDHFFSESFRVLKKGGYLISSTNNLSSWHNIFSLVLGWTPFDFTNCSSKGLGIGNPLAIHQGEKTYRGSSWTHKCIYTTKWLEEWGALYGFKAIDVLGAGYYPFPGYLGRYEKKHCAFITTIMQSS